MARALTHLHTHNESSTETIIDSESKSSSPKRSSSSGRSVGPGVAFSALTPRHIVLSANGAVAKLIDLSHCVHLRKLSSHSSDDTGNINLESTATAEVADHHSSVQQPLKHLYLAPEVCLGKGFGTPADLFSLGLLLWELTHQKRFPVSNFEVYLELVVLGMRRPRVDLAAATSPCRAKVLPELLRCCWRSNASLRPRADLVADILEALVEDKPPTYQTLNSGWFPLSCAAQNPGSLKMPRRCDDCSSPPERP